MKLFKTAVILGFVLIMGACSNAEKKQDIQFDTSQCEGRPHYIGRDKDEFIYIFGFDNNRTVDSAGYTFVYWDEAGVSMYYDSDNKVVDYTMD